MVLGLVSAAAVIMFGCTVFNFLVVAAVGVMATPSLDTRAANGIFSRLVMILLTALSVGTSALDFLRNLGPHWCVVALGLEMMMGEMAGTCWTCDQVSSTCV